MAIELPDDTEARLAAARHVVLRRIRRRRRVTTGIVACALLVAAGSGVGATLVVRQLSEQESATFVRCYVHDDLGSFHGDAAQATAMPSPGGTAAQEPAPDKRELCELVWRSGLAVQAAGGHPKVDSFTGLGDYRVPPLAFCVLADGGTGGFPIEAPSRTAAQVCDRLGLPVDGSVPAS